MGDPMRAARLSIVVGVLVGVLSASAAWAYTGTTAGKKLAGQMLGSYKHVQYLAGSEHGGVYYCTSGTLEGFSLGSVATLPSKCGAKPVTATVSWVATLSDGKGASAVGTVVAHGHPTIGWVANRHGTFYEPAGSHCWVTSQAVDSTFVGYAPFGFFPAESMSVGGHHGSDVQLIGTMGHGDFKEVDTIDSHTHHIVGENINFAIKERQQAWNLITSYHEPSKGPKTPTTKPAC
jgi:hypothetical protein